MKTIIYYRKSTDRDDKQANSLEHQLENCLRVSEKYNLDVVDKIGESKSAKDEGTRKGFNRMIKLCKTGRIDFIVMDEPKRLSRNNIDTSRIIDLMDKNLIKGILGSSREYRSDNSRDKFLLQLDLSLSKMDNEDRSKDVKEKMETCMRNTKRFLGRVPYGYKNVTIKKGHKEVKIDKEEAKVVKEIFSLRIENKAYSTICNILDEKYGKDINLLLNPSRLQKLAINKFYYGMFTWAGQERVGSHKPIITKEIYDEANNVGKGTHEKIETIKKEKSKKRVTRKYMLKGIVKDEEGIFLTAYTKKENIYYMAQYHSQAKVNISEVLLFEKIETYLKESEKENKALTSIDEDIILDLLKLEESKKGSDIIKLERDIQKIKKRQDNLLDMKLDGLVTKEKFVEKMSEFENKIKQLEDLKKSEKSNDFEEKTKHMFELAGSFYRSYKGVSLETKIEIIKKLFSSLKLNSKKELCIEDNPLLQSSKMLNFYFGTPTENRTPVTGMRIPGPNH